MRGRRGAQRRSCTLRVQVTMRGLVALDRLSVCWHCMASVQRQHGPSVEAPLLDKTFHWWIKALFLLFKEDLPHPYDAWISIARNLPELIKNNQLRVEVEKVWKKILHVFYFSFLKALTWFCGTHITHSELSPSLHLFSVSNAQHWWPPRPQGTAPGTLGSGIHHDGVCVGSRWWRHPKGLEIFIYSFMLTQQTDIQLTFNVNEL